MSTLPAASRRWLTAIGHLGVAIDVVVIPEGSKSAADAAAGIGCAVHHIVKSLVFTADGSPVVALVPGDRRLDPARLAAAADAGTVRRADLDTVRSATGFVAGGVPPFGHATRLPVYADTALDADATLWIACGTPDTVAAITYTDLLRASDARPVALSGPPDP